MAASSQAARPRSAASTRLQGLHLHHHQNAYALKARAGWAIDRFLVSGNAGAVYTTTNYLKLKDWGWTAGVNVDYAVTDHLIVGAQYTHMGFKNFDTTQIDARIDLSPPGSPTSSDPVSHRYCIEAVRHSRSAFIISAAETFD